MPNLINKTILQTTNLTRKYRVGRESVIALNGVDIDIQKGEFVAIMGASGSGKTIDLHKLSPFEISGTLSQLMFIF